MQPRNGQSPVFSLLPIPPIKDIWLKAKHWLRECYHQLKSFRDAKIRFELQLQYQTFDFALGKIYHPNSLII
jgi:hypothetical protein